TINADIVSIKPFGKVQPIGGRTYKIKNFKDEKITFVLTAENSFIGRKIQYTLTLDNKTYADLFEQISKKIKNNELLENAEQNVQKEANIKSDNQDLSIFSMIAINIGLLAAMLLL